MAATVEGFFRIHDRASGPMRKMEAQAKKTDAAIQKLGDDLDRNVGNTGQIRQMERTQKKLRDIEVQVDATGGHRGGGGFRRATRHVDGFGAALRRAGLNLAALGKIFRLLRIPALVTALGLLAGAVGALGGALVALTPAAVSAVGVLGAMIPKITQLGGAAAAAGPAILGLVLATKTVTMAFKDMDQALAGNEEAMKRMTPQARQFIQTLKMYQPVLEGLRATAQGGGLFSGLDFALRRGQRAIPVLNSLIGMMSKRLGDLARQAATRFTGRGFLQDIMGIGQQGGRMVSAGGRSLMNIADALRHVLVAAQPFTNWLTRTVEGWSRWILNAARAGRESGRLGTFFDRLRGTMTRFGHILRNMWQIWQAFSRASRSVGNSLWRSFDQATKRWASFLNSAEGQGRMRNWLRRAREDFHRIWSIVTNVTKGLVGLGRAARPAGDILYRAADRATGKWAEFTNSMGGQISLGRGFLGIVDFTREFMGLISAITSALFRLGQSRALVDVTRGLREGVPTLERFLDVMVRAFAPAFMELLGEIMRMFMWLSTATGPVVLFMRLLARILGLVNSAISAVPGLGRVLATAFSVLILTRFANRLLGILGTLRLIQAVGGSMAIFGGRGGRGGSGGGRGGGGIGWPVIFGGGGRGGGGVVPPGAHPRMFPTVAGGGGRFGGFRGLGKLGLRGAGGLGGVAALGGSLALGAAFGGESRVASIGGSALTGAAIGATAGSIIPGLGTAVGAGVGAGLGAGYGFFSSRGAGRSNIYDSTQKAMQQTLAMQGGDDPTRKQLGSQVSYLTQLSRSLKTQTTETGRAAWVSVNRELRARAQVLRTINAQIKAERQYKMEQQGQASVARGRMVGRRLATRFGVDERSMGTGGALEAMAPRVLSQLEKLKPEGRKVLAEGVVQWANALKTRQPEVTKQVDALNREILESFRKTNRNVELVNGKILTGSKTQWKGIRGALLSEAKLAEDGLSASFGRIQAMAIGQLKSMGYSDAEAQQILQGTLRGNVSGTRGSMNAYAGLSPGATVAPDGRAGMGANGQRDGIGIGTTNTGAVSRNNGSSNTGGGSSLVQVGRMLQSMGFQVGEHPLFGGVAPGVHTPTSYHYKGMALDVNWPGGGAAEMAAIDRIYPMLRSLNPTELLWRTKGHYDHLHLAMGGQGSFVPGMAGGLGAPSFRLTAPATGARGVPGALGDAAASGLATGLSGALGASWGGWYGNGGKIRASRPTIIGVGEKGAEDVTITRTGRGGSIVFQPSVTIQRIDYRGEGDIETVVAAELEKAFDDFAQKIENGGLVSEGSLL